MLLEIVTRHLYTRKLQLKRLEKSLAGQTSQHFIHTILVDDVGVGVEKANVTLREFAPSFTGDYIWLIDDDDIIINETIVADLEQIAEEFKPDVIMILVKHPSGEGRLPPSELWMRRPEINQISMSNFITRRDIYQANAEAFKEQLCADFNFVNSIFEDDIEVYWHPVEAVKVIEASRGARGF